MSDRLRIVAWNCRRAARASAAWDYLLELDPDVALLQEMGTMPATVAERYAVASAIPPTPSGRPQRFATGVLVKGRIDDDLALEPSVDWVARELDFLRGCFVAKRVTVASGPSLRVISVYSPAFPVERSRLAGVDTSGIQLTQNRDVWPTEILWACLRSMEIRTGEPLVVGGDFNSSETFDTMWGDGPRGNLEVIERMNALGLWDCLRTFRGQLTPTFRTPRGGFVVHQLDHLYVTKPLLGRLAHCGVGCAERVFGSTPSLSDHLPIVADFAWAG